MMSPCNLQWKHHKMMIKLLQLTGMMSCKVCRLVSRMIPQMPLGQCLPPTLTPFMMPKIVTKQWATTTKGNLFESNDSLMPLKSANTLFEQNRATSKKSARAIKNFELHLDHDAALMPPLDLEHLAGSPSTSIDKEKKLMFVTMESKAKQFNLNSCHKPNENSDCHSPTRPISSPLCSMQAFAGVPKFLFLGREQRSNWTKGKSRKT